MSRVCSSATGRQVGRTEVCLVLLMKAQEAVTGYDEFKETTRYIETRGFFRDGPISPRPIRYHWCCNAETYWLIGEHMGHAMVELLGGRKAPGIPGSQSN